LHPGTLKDLSAWMCGFAGDSGRNITDRCR
jgi:hypothetical protein